MIGTVRVVRDERLGGEVAVAATATDTTLVLDSVDDFEEDGGEVVGSTGLVSSYTAADFDTKTLSGIPAMSAPVAAGFGAGDWAAPYSADHEDTERLAEVDVGEGPAVIAVVPHSLRPLLQPGTRDPETGEQVDLWEPTEGALEVRNVRGKEPGIVGPSIDVPERGGFGIHVSVDGTIGLGGITEADAAVVVLPDGSVIEINSPLNLGGLGFVHGVYVDMQSFTVAPASPGAGLARIYAYDNGTKISLRVKFPSGIAQVIATEP